MYSMIPAIVPLEEMDKIALDVDYYISNRDAEEDEFEVEGILLKVWFVLADQICVTQKDGRSYPIYFPKNKFLKPDDADAFVIDDTYIFMNPIHFMNGEYYFTNNTSANCLIWYHKVEAA